MKPCTHTPNCPTPRDAYTSSKQHHEAMERQGAVHRQMMTGQLPKISKQQEAKPGGVRGY